MPSNPASPVPTRTRGPVRQANGPRLRNTAAARRRLTTHAQTPVGGAIAPRVNGSGPGDPGQQSPRGARTDRDLADADTAAAGSPPTGAEVQPPPAQPGQSVASAAGFRQSVMALAPARPRAAAVPETRRASGNFAMFLAFVERQLDRTGSLLGWMTMFGCIAGAVIAAIFCATSFLPHVGLSAIAVALLTATGGGAGGYAVGRMLGRRRAAARDDEAVRAEAAVDQDPGEVTDHGRQAPELGAGHHG
ncbi:hypothetical protein [Dactylosporangium sp. NPDC048998]|uniref:hypothetical protein n=1 Tax=Dactylosporangium sp. NPDC048998 TaxID=3363976 RepID=UPI0037194787